MYTIFFEDKPIVLMATPDMSLGYECYKLKKVKLVKVIKKLNSDRVKGVILTHKKEKKILKKFLKKLPNVVASGGKVYNKQGDVLFIYRNDKWDLPKGKLEKKENIEHAALREVYEETGVSDLKIEAPLDVTYHIFKRNGAYKIKITHWYKMTTDYDGDLIPQQEEGITKVAWLKPEQIKAALDNSYANIKLLV